MSGVPVPVGFVVRLRDVVERVDNGRAFVGGSPVRLVRLSARARTLLADDVLHVQDAQTGVLARRLLDGNLADPVLDAVDVSPADLTVVVPVRDRAEQLGRCLAELAPLSVIVVDDGSIASEAVAEVVRGHGATLVALPQNVGPAGARNAGLARVGSALVAFVDSDVVVSADALLALARHCSDPQVALVGPAVVGRCRSSRPRWFERYDVVASSLDLGRSAGQVRPGAAVGWLPSACLVGRTALLGEGFDERMRVGEDVDLVWRLTEQGHAVRYDASVRAYHDVRPTAFGWLGRKFVYGTGGADLASRHGDKAAPAVLSPVIAAGAAAILARRRWSAPVAAVALAVSVRSLRDRLPIERDRTSVAMNLSLRGLVWGARQESALLLRHWWPLAATAAPFSRSVRRALVSAVVIDAAVFQSERPGVGLATALAARRLDDLSYGAGLWWGAIRRRSIRCLLPRRPGR